MAPPYWWPLLAGLLGVSLLLHTYLLTALVLMVMIVSGLAEYWRRHALDDIRYRRRPFYWRGFPGESIPMQIEVENHKFLPVSWLHVSDLWPRAAAPDDPSVISPTYKPDIVQLVNLFSLRWYERARRSYSLLLQKRGVYPVGPTTFEGGDLFGLFKQRWEDGPVQFLTVFPEKYPFKALPLPSDDPFGDRRARRRLYEDPNQPMGVRDYHPEDDFRHVHWPATAHTGTLQVKVYQPAAAQVMVVCLNVATFARYWEGIYPELLEHLLSVTATLVERGLKDGYRVGLISNGCLAHADQPFRVPPGRSPRQLTHLLETLAAVTPLVTGAFERFLIAEVPRLPYGATLVVVTGVVSAELAETLFRLKQHGRKIILLSFGRETPPDIPGISLYHQPFYGSSE
jgi:uncharacterized protein (DUF58 family)